MRDSSVYLFTKYLQCCFIPENFTHNEHKSNIHKTTTTSSTSQNVPSSREKVERLECEERMKREKVDSPSETYGQQPVRELPPPPENKPWGYSGIDLMNSEGAFWQNYSGEFQLY